MNEENIWSDIQEKINKYHDKTLIKPEKSPMEI